MECGLPTDLNQLCFMTFSKCEYFEDFEKLLAFCKGIEGLNPLKLKLKRAESIKDVIDKNLPIFIEYQHDYYGWALPLLIHGLMLRYQSLEDILWKDLKILYDQIKDFESQQKHKLIPKKEREYLIFRSILDIDFEEQEQEFIEAIEFDSNNKVAAFLIHGVEKHGQEILVTRLSRVRQLCNGRKIKIKLGGMGNISQLWNEVAKHFFQSEIPAKISKEEIIERILECLQTQHIIFIFDEVHCAYTGFLPQLIEDFWKPIINEFTDPKKYLVMFWVDNQARICNSGISLVYHPSEYDYPTIPLCLTQVNRFSYKKLKKWLAKTDENIIPDISIENLLKDSKSGVPELVYQEICVYCNSSWEGRLAQWLTQ